MRSITLIRQGHIYIHIVPAVNDGDYIKTIHKTAGNETANMNVTDDRIQL